MPIGISSKILIITHAHNRPEFIPLQDVTFKEFLKDDYEFVVFNDARDEKIDKEIFETYNQLSAVFMLDETFLHYQNRTNWNNKSSDYHKNKFKKLETFINHIIV